MRVYLVSAALAAIVLSSPSLIAGEKASFVSHTPMRPLPAPVQRPLVQGPAVFVDAVKGSDSADGTVAKPWQSLTHAVAQLKPGQTLYLRGGTYYEHVVITASGTPQAPITIRSYPGELAVIDGGLRDFQEHPEKAWEPVPDGAPGEYRSVKAYNDLGSSGNQTHLLGNFGDSLVPLHGYKYMNDLRSANVYFNLPVNTGPEGNIYCGPGVCHDLATGRIHVRLAHTRMKYLPAEDNYQGETDPRKLPLIIAGNRDASPLSLRGVRHVRIQDLVVRGARGPTVAVEGAEDIEFDGLTVYGGSTCFAVRETIGLRILNTASRGIAAPWTFRGSLKYRAIEARIFSASGWQPTGRDSRDFRLAYSEFTDCVDGVFLGNVRGVRFHHNLLDNVTDDGVFLTAATAYDGSTPGGDVHIYANRFSRCLTTFAFGVGHGRQKVLTTGLQTGSGAIIFRNVFDFRRPVLYHQPRDEKAPQEVTSKGRFASDHGSPAWEPMTIYHNTIIADDAPRYSYGTWGLGNAVGRGTKRRVFNNIVVQLEALPGNLFPPSTTDFQADGNLLWSVTKGPAQQGDLFGKFRQSKEFAASKVNYAPGWGTNDRFAEPKFVRFASDWQASLDLRLQETSPAVDAGVPLPQEWPDPWRGRDKGKPDMGAAPLGVEPWHVGQFGRLTVFGDAKPLGSPHPALSPGGRGWGEGEPPHKYTPQPVIVSKQTRPIAIVEGYPAFDVPLLSYALRKQGGNIEVFERAWLAPEKYSSYSTVILTGNLVRAKVTPNRYSAEDLTKIDSFLKEGGTLVVTVSGRDVFQLPEGRAFLANITGGGIPSKDGIAKVLMPSHPWVKHVQGDAPWLSGLVKRPGFALGSRAGENILGTADGSTVLYRQSVGKGEFLYVGWTIHDSLPYTREKLPTVEQERQFEEQMTILLNMAADLVSR